MVKKTLLLFFILIAIGCYYYLFEKGNKKEEKEREKTVPPPKKVLNFKRGDLQEITLTKGDGKRIHYQKNIEGWLMVEPLRIQGNATALDPLLDDLENIIEIETISENPQNLKEFGLDNPSITVTLRTTKSVPPLILLLGKDHPTHTTIYAKMADSPRVFMVGSLTRWIIEREFDNLKNRQGPFFKKDN